MKILLTLYSICVFVGVFFKYLIVYITTICATLLYMVGEFTEWVIEKVKKRK